MRVCNPPSLSMPLPTISTHTLDPLGEATVLAAIEKPGLSQSVLPDPPPPPAEMRPLDRFASTATVFPPSRAVNSMDWGVSLKLTLEFPEEDFIRKQSSAMTVPLDTEMGSELEVFHEIIRAWSDSMDSELMEALLKLSRLKARPSTNSIKSVSNLMLYCIPIISLKLVTVIGTHTVSPWLPDAVPMVRPTRPGPLPPSPMVTVPGLAVFIPISIN